ncbi:MAG TPA: phosphate ABC transporter ATP-binding protein PstB, partial [Gemmatimonadales bacterium]|nr:phosphate ABC transporter ATP-binding protein PstB [Gemmatimonadales bacterium]
MAEPPVSIRAQGLSALYGPHAAVRDVSLAVPANTVTAIIGPSGCGKSTFLRCLNRLHELAPGASVRGQVYLEEQDIYAPGVSPVAVRRRIGMVFQQPNPFPTMTIARNVAAGLSVNGRRSKGETDDAVERALREAALWDEVKDRLRASPLALSGGQQQRLCIARAIAPEPDVLLLDEPTSALDPIATQSIEELVQELKRDFTVVLVTHNMQQAARVSDSTAFFYLGELVEHDETARIFTN